MLTAVRRIAGTTNILEPTFIGPNHELTPILLLLAQVVAIVAEQFAVMAGVVVLPGVGPARITAEWHIGFNDE